MKLQKLLGATALSVVMATGAFAQTDVSGKTLGVLVITMQSETLSTWSSEVQQAADAIGWEVILKDGENNPALIAQKIPELLAQGVDGIITMAIDAPLVSEGLQQADAAGVPVIATNVGVNPVGAEMFDGVYAVDSLKIGQMLADYMVAQDPDATAVGQTIQIVFSADELVVGAKEALGDKLLEIADTDAANLGQSFTQTTVDLIQGNPEADYFISCCDFAPLMVFPALGSIDATEVTYLGRVDNPSTLQGMRAGQKAAVVANRSVFDLAAIDAMAAYFADGTEIPYTIDGLTGDLKVVDNDTIPAEGRVYPFEAELAEYSAKWSELYGQ